MQNYLYKCEFCMIAKFSVVDKGEVWFIDCMGCRSMQFHHKLIVELDLNTGEMIFNCAMDDKEVEG